MRHQTLAGGRWATLTLAEQLGNVGSEFDRVVAAQKRGDTTRFDYATKRFFELMELTLSDPRWRGLRRRELARVAEECAALFQEPASTNIQKQQQYFYQFALLARAKR